MMETKDTPDATYMACCSWFLIKKNEHSTNKKSDVNHTKKSSKRLLCWVTFLSWWGFLPLSLWFCSTQSMSDKKQLHWLLSSEESLQGSPPLSLRLVHWSMIINTIVHNKGNFLLYPWVEAALGWVLGGWGNLTKSVTVNEVIAKFKTLKRGGKD